MIIYSELAVLIADQKYFDIVIPRHYEGVIFFVFSILLLKANFFVYVVVVAVFLICKIIRY